MAATFEQARYWQIAKPLVDELCAQWTRDRDSISCTAETLLTFLRDMYQIFLPQMAFSPDTATPLDYVEAIESHLRQSTVTDLDGSLAALYQGTKRKRYLHEGSSEEEGQIRPQSCRRIEGPLMDSDKIGTDWCYFPLPHRSLQRGSHYEYDQEMQEPETLRNNLGATIPGDAMNINDEDSSEQVQGAEEATQDINQANISDGIGSESPASNCSRDLGHSDNPFVVASFDRVQGSEERATEDTDQATDSDGTSSGSPTSNCNQDLGHWHPDVATSDHLDMPEGTGASFDRLLEEFDSNPDKLNNSNQDTSATHMGMRDTDNMTPEIVDELFVPMGDHGPSIHTPPLGAACQMPPGNKISTTTPQTMPSHLSAADAEELASSWRVPEDIGQAIANTFPRSLPTPPTNGSASQAIERDKADPPTSTTGDATDLPLNIENLRRLLLDRWGDDTPALIYGGQLTRDHIGKLLGELQDPRCLSDSSVDVLGSRLSQQHRPEDLYIGQTDWQNRAHQGSLRLSPFPGRLLLPTREHGGWSLIEAQADQRAVIHYRFPVGEVSPDLEHHPKHGCSACQTAVNLMAQEACQAGREWQFRCPTTEGGQEGGTHFLWTLTQRADGQPAPVKPPEMFRSHLARTIVTEVFQCRSEPRSPSPANRAGLTPPEMMRRHWSGVAGRCGPMDVTTMLEQVAQTPAGVSTVGWERADQLLQLAFNIASPLVLVEIRRQLLHLRTRRDTAACPFGRNAGGVFEAGLWHKSNEHTSRIGLALSCWYIHDHRQRLREEGSPDPVGQTVRDIVHQLPATSRDYGQVEERVKDWCRRAWPWNQLVRIAGSPNVLCFLPQGVGFFPGAEGATMTDYRTLKKADFDALETVIQRFRPHLVRTVPSNFFEIFLYNRLPPDRFAIEEWTEQDILNEPLDSEKFDHAFDLNT